MPNVSFFEMQTNGGGTGVLPAIGTITPASTLATFAPYGRQVASRPIDFGWMQPVFNPASDTICVVPDAGATVNIAFKDRSKQSISTPTYITASVFRSPQ